jgi:Spy/CpxP family protein refolding chaperone
MNSTGKRVWIALAISLTLNLFGLGFLSARFWHGRPTDHGGPHGPFFGPGGLLLDAELAGPLDAQVRGVMERHREALRAQREQLRDARAAVHVALTSEPFDAEALKSALGRLRQMTDQSQALMHAALIEIAPSLTHEQRERLEPMHRPHGGPRPH